VTTVSATVEAAQSAAIRESVWAWYASVARTRLMPDAVEVVCGTCWHEDDLLAHRVFKRKVTSGAFNPFKEATMSRLPRTAAWLALAATVIAVTGFFIDSGPTTAQINRQPRATNQSVAMGLGVDGGVAQLHAFSLGDFKLDLSKLSFTAWPYGKLDATERPVMVSLGPPVLVPSRTRGTAITEFTMRVEFPKAPGPPGMYDIQLHAAEGFARANDGTPILFGDWSRSGSQNWRIDVWWPSNPERSLESMRTRLVGKELYGYGGVRLSCPPLFWLYDAHTPVRVRAVERVRGRVDELWTGTPVSGGNDMAPHFFANDPLRIIFDRPSAKPWGFGGGGPTAHEACPALELADWQVDVTLSPKPPPDSIPHNIGCGGLHVGMSREDVAWRCGFPHDIGDRATLDRQKLWTYDTAAPFSFAVTFEGDKVSSFTTPGRLP